MNKVYVFKNILYIDSYIVLLKCNIINKVCIFLY